MGHDRLFNGKRFRINSKSKFDKCVGDFEGARLEVCRCTSSAFPFSGTVREKDRTFYKTEKRESETVRTFNLLFSRSRDGS